MNKKAVIKYGLISLGLLILTLTSGSVGYYFGWVHEWRYQNRQIIGDVFMSTYSLDSIHSTCNCDSVHLRFAEMALDAAMQKYVSSRENGGSLGINYLFMDKASDANIRKYAKIVANYRKRHPNPGLMSQIETGSSESNNKNDPYASLVDTLVAKILRE